MLADPDLETVSLLVDATRPAARQVQVRLLDDAEDQQLGALGRCHADGLVDGALQALDRSIASRTRRPGSPSGAVPCRAWCGRAGCQAMVHSGRVRGPSGPSVGHSHLLRSAKRDADRPVTPPPDPVYDALDAATRAIAGRLSVDEVLQVIVDQVRPLVGARYAALGIVDEHGIIERFITCGIDAEDRAQRSARCPRGHGLLGLIIRENRAFRIADIDADPRRHGFPPNHPPMTVPRRADHGQGPLGRQPLPDRQGGGDEFTEADQQLVEFFARHAGIAIENARLHEQVQRLAIVEERERIGKDLHDGIIQSLYAVGLSLEDVPELMDDDPAEACAASSARSTTSTSRSATSATSSSGLRPELLGGTTLIAGLAALVDEFRAQHDDRRRAARRAAWTGEPPADVTADLLGIVSEALSNVARHSRRVARRGRWIERPDGGLVLEIDRQWARLRRLDRRAPRSPGTREHALSGGRRSVRHLDDRAAATAGNDHRPSTCPTTGSRRHRR